MSRAMAIFSSSLVPWRCVQSSNLLDKAVRSRMLCASEAFGLLLDVLVRVWSRALFLVKESRASDDLDVCRAGDCDRLTGDSANRTLKSPNKRASMAVAETRREPPRFGDIGECACDPDSALCRMCSAAFLAASFTMVVSCGLKSLSFMARRAGPNIVVADACWLDPCPPAEKLVFAFIILTSLVMLPAPFKRVPLTLISPEGST